MCRVTGKRNLLAGEGYCHNFVGGTDGDPLFNDDMAFGLLRAAHEGEVQVPEDVSVVVFDDRSPAATSSPFLSTVRKPLALIGRRAAEMLIGIIEERLPPDVREIVRPELVLRIWTAPPPM